MGGAGRVALLFRDRVFSWFKGELQVKGGVVSRKNKNDRMGSLHTLCSLGWQGFDTPFGLPSCHPFQPIVDRHPFAPDRPSTSVLVPFGTGPGDPGDPVPVPKRYGTPRPNGHRATDSDGFLDPTASDAASRTRSRTRLSSVPFHDASTARYGSRPSGDVGHGYVSGFVPLGRWNSGPSRWVALGLEDPKLHRFLDPRISCAGIS